jgi:hypothetical protein
MHSEERHDLCSLLNTRMIKEDVMGMARCIHWVNVNARNAYTVWWVNLKKIDVFEDRLYSKVVRWFYEDCIQPNQA